MGAAAGAARALAARTVHCHVCSVPGTRPVRGSALRVAELRWGTAAVAGVECAGPGASPCWWVRSKEKPRGTVLQQPCLAHAGGGEQQHSPCSSLMER